MQTILYMAITLNGLIATTTDDVSWTSKEGWAGFVAMAQKVGNAIIGRRTWEIVKKEGSQIENCLTVVLTKNRRLVAARADTIVTNQKPKEVLLMLARKGFKEALVCGGGQLNRSFLKEKLIDEMYIDIEPLILGRGIPLVAPTNLEARLKLVSLKKLNQNTLQLHYKVLK